MASKKLIHKLDPRHLAILQYLDSTLDDDGQERYLSETRIQNSVRFAPDMTLAPVNPRSGRRIGEALAIGEELHDLTVKLNAKDDPFVIIHASGKHYTITETGRLMARKCSIALRTDPYGVKVPTVIETAKRKPPMLTSVESAQPIMPDDEEDEEPITLPSVEEIQGAGPKIEVVGDGGAEEEEVLTGSGRDEINDSEPTRAAPATSRRPAAKPAKKSPTKHSRATVPGKSE